MRPCLAVPDPEHGLRLYQARNYQQVASCWKSITFVPIDTLNKTYPLRELNPCLRLEKAMSLPLDERDLISCLTHLSVLMVLLCLLYAYHHIYCLLVLRERGALVRILPLALGHNRSANGNKDIYLLFACLSCALLRLS